MTESGEWVHVSCSLSPLTCQDPLRGEVAQEDALCPLVTADWLWKSEQAVEAFQKMMHAWCNAHWGCISGILRCSSLLSWSNGSAPSAVVRHLGVWIFKEPHTQICFCLREVWLVVNLPFGERTPGNGLVTSYYSDGRRVELAFLWAGHLKNSDLSISRAQHTLCRCFCP